MSRLRLKSQVVGGLVATALGSLSGLSFSATVATVAADVVDWDSAQIDLSFLNKDERPAGKHGFVRAQGESLVFEDGHRARFWGVNITAAALFGSTPASVQDQARQLSRLGFNLVRLHHHDSYWVRPNIFGEQSSSTSGRIDEQMQERIDWWIKCLKDEGIYVWLDLHVQRNLQPSEGIDDFDELAKGKPAGDLKGFNYLNASIERAMQAFNEAYLRHVNVHTKLAYADDPAIAAVLITNENDLTQHYGNALLPDKGVPKHSARYMRAASQFATLHHLDQDRVWKAWQPGESKLFLNDLERQFSERMINHLRTKVEVKVPIVTTNLWGWQMASLPALTVGDMIDIHAYEEPGFVARDPNKAVSAVQMIAAAQVRGMPTSVTEWNIGKFPADDRQDLPVWMAATGSRQGWDALMHYAYAQTPFDRAAKASNWHAFNDPARLAMMPAAALLFRQGHVRESTTNYVWAPTVEQLFFRGDGPSSIAGLRFAAEVGRLTTVLPQTRELPWLKPRNDAQAARTTLPSAVPAKVGGLSSDTGEVSRDWQQGTLVIDTQRSQIVEGLIGGKTVNLVDVQVRVQSRHASVAVQSLDSQPISSSSNILVSLATPSALSPNDQLPYAGENISGSLTIRAVPGLQLVPQPGVQAKYADGRYQVVLDGTQPVHWLTLRREPGSQR